MERPRALGLPALVLGMMTLGSSMDIVFGASYAWISLSGLADVAGIIGGLALTLIGISILQEWGKFALEPDETR